MAFFILIFSLPVLSLAWWAWGDWMLRRHRFGKKARLALLAFALLQTGTYIALMFSRFQELHWKLPAWMLALAFLWHLIIAPLSILAVVFASTLRAAARFLMKSRRPVAIEVSPANATGPTRRQLLAGAAVALPPLLTVGAGTVGLSKLGEFRIRPIRVGIPNLPAALEGLRIVHVADVHVGRFTNAAKLREIVHRTNELDPDLVLMTGDLIDFDLDDLPAGIEMMHGFRSRYGVLTCEGNHDLIESREDFEQQMRKADVGLLLNEDRVLNIRGQRVQIMGMRWGAAGQRRDALVNTHVKQMVSMARPDAFPILLAHHPHAFDKAFENGVPLTLAGHTHGGQVMLTPHLGPGSFMFKYWSGLYRQNNCALVVSNGVGNWFPLRINAPAEIVEITLARA